MCDKGNFHEIGVYSTGGIYVLVIGTNVFQLTIIHKLP